MTSHNQETHTGGQSGKVRILYQLVSPLHRSAGQGEIDRRLQMLKAWAPESDIDIASPEDGPAAVESASDAAMVFPSLRKAAQGWQDRGYDAVVIGCFSDPAIGALKETSGIQVIGPGEAGMLAAVQLGERFSVLSSTPTPPGLRRRIRGIGIEPMFVSERLVSASVAQLVGDPERHMPGIIDQARLCIDAGADVIVLGCLAMSFAPGIPEALSDAIGIPVINPVIAGLKAAETIMLHQARRPAEKVQEPKTAFCEGSEE
ncbi:aspartate/glutamate racemase family protein [uncultured Martelella sp.]|uniref:aspartate/glutamate racemase family protein n=1 Tax=uncultured Martelella sp. TaxID=392331 RepID=UPI0029C6B583|nr:aspartate/glutamate racemase family protein [uncultured Martelella sp.]